MQRSKDQLSAALSAQTSRAQARRTLAALFAGVGIDSADLDARVLVCAACDVDHAGLIRDPEAPLGGDADKLAAFARRRIAREPVSRILGRREFWGLAFTIGPDVLDPRPETEGVVGAVLDAIGMRRGDRLEVLDLGVGSGAILGALLHELPSARGLGLDRSFEACRIARGNLAALGFTARAGIVCGDWAAAIGGRFDVVVSNPPYVAKGELGALAPDVRDHDPAAALDGGPDGLDAYRVIVAGLGDLLRPAGVVAFECGRGQGGILAGMIRGVGLQGVAVYRDLAGHDRVVVAQAAG